MPKGRIIDGEPIESAGYSYLNPYVERYDLENIIQDSSVNEQLVALIPDKMDEFKRKLFIYDLGLTDDFIVATGIAPSSGTMQEGFIALSKNSKDVYLAILDTESVKNYNSNQPFIKTVSIYTNRNSTYASSPKGLQKWIERFEHPIIKWNYSSSDPIIPASEQTALIETDDTIPEQLDQVKASFNCSKASEGIEVLIFSDAELADFDAKVAELYNKKRATNNNSDGYADVKKEQKSFLNERIRVCKIPHSIKSDDNSSTAVMVSCLKKLYQKRIKGLDGRYKIDFSRLR